MLLYELISASRWAETVIKPNAGFSFTTELLFIKKIQIKSKKSKILGLLIFFKWDLST